MKAYNLHGVNDLRYENVQMPELPSDWALVKVGACGICSSDIPRIYKNGTYHFPTVVGHEFSGVVEKTANDGDSHWVGKRVAVFPLIPCKKCEQCKNKHYEMCSDYNYLGSRCDGGFSEYVAVPVWNLIELGDSISYEEGALFEPLAVALHCVNQAQLRGGETVAVIGSGAIAFAVGQWAKIKGAAQVGIVARSKSKEFIAERTGLDFVTGENIEGRFYDVVVEAVGTQESLISAIKHTRAGGKIVAMGNPVGDMNLPQAVYWKILRKQLTVIGTWNSFYDGANMSDWIEVRDALINKTIDAKSLITHYFDKDRVVDGLELMKNHKEPYCKVMTVWEDKTK